MKRAFTTLDIGKLKKAIDKGVDVNTFVEHTRPVVLAFQKGRHDFMEVLATAGANLDLYNSDGFSFAGEVAQKGDSTALEILGKYGADFHLKADTIGHNLPTYFAATGNLPFLEIVMKYTKRNVKDHNGGKTPTHYAPDRKTLQYLIQQGEDVNAPDSIGNTPMHNVSTLQAAVALHEAGAEINAVNDCLVPAIFYQVGNGNGRVYQYLLKQGAIVDTVDDYGQSILTYAMMTENELLHRKVVDNYCEFYPEKCEQAKKRLKSAGIKALATVVYTKTAHKAIMSRIAAKQAAKGAVRRAILRRAGGKIFFRLIPIIGGALTIYDLAKIAEATAEYDKAIREHRAEADRLAAQRREAQQLLREQFLTCNVPRPASHKKSNHTVAISPVAK